jgi:hypothetical protein
MSTADEREFFRESFFVFVDAIIVLGKVDRFIFVGIANLKESFDCSRTDFRITSTNYLIIPVLLRVSLEKSLFSHFCFCPMKIHFEKIEEHFNLNLVIQARFCEVLEQRARCWCKNTNAK